MRFILNENMPSSLSRALRERGHDVAAVKEDMRGADDEDVLARAQRERRLVLTQDKDFGALAFRYRLPAACGVILFRLAGRSPDQDVRRMLEVLEGGKSWEGHFAVVTESQLRIRPLPPTKARS